MSKGIRISYNPTHFDPHFSIQDTAYMKQNVGGISIINNDIHLFDNKIIPDPYKVEPYHTMSPEEQIHHLNNLLCL